MINNIIYFICNLLSVFSLHIFCSKMFQDKIVKLVRVSANVIYMALDFVVYLLNDNQAVFIITSMVMYFGFSVAYSLHISYKNFIITMVILAFGICSELLASFIVSFSAGILGHYEAGGGIIATMVLSRFLFFLFIVISSGFIRFQNNTDISGRYVWCILMLPVLSIGLVLYIFSLARFDQNTIYNSGSVGAAFSVAANVGMNILTFYIMERQHELFFAEKEEAVLRQTILSQQMYYDEKRFANDSIRRVKHDYKNMLVSIKADIASGNKDDAVAAIDKEIGKVETVSMPESGNLAIDSIMMYKAGIAAEKKISIITKYRLEGTPQIENSDICVLLGNAIDNAVEYLESHQECRQEIRVYIVYSKDILDIKIRNEVSDKIQISGNCIKTTKKENGHGYGLKSIECIARKYDGEMFLACTGGVFENGIIMNCPERILKSVR